MTKPNDKIEKIARGAGLIAVAYFISRVLGLIREMVIASRYGAGKLTDLYNAAFQIPDMFNYLLAGGAFSIVLIPMLAKHVTGDRFPRIDDEGSKIFYRVFFPLTVVVVGISLVLIVLAPQISMLLYPGFQTDTQRFSLLVRLTRIVIPAQIFFLVGGLYNAALRACGDFRGNVWGPNLYNLGIIAGAILLAPFLSIAGVSVGVLIGALSGPFLACYLLGRKRLTRRLTWRFFSPEFREYIILSLPLMLGFSLLTTDQWFTRIFGAKAGVAIGTITCLNYARTIMLVPIGLIGQSVGQASLTYLSQLWQQGKKQEFLSTFQETLNGVFFLSFIISGLLFMLAQPVVALIFLRRAFTLKNSITTAALLRIMVFAVPAFAAQQTLVNGYYSKKNTLRPMIISSSVSAVSFFIYWYLQVKLSGFGIALASALCLWLQFFVTLADYHLHYGRREGLSLSPIFQTVFKGLAFSTIAYFAGILISHLFFSEVLQLHRTLDAIVRIVVLGGVFTAAVIGLTLMVGGPEARVLRRFWGSMLRRIRKP